MHRHFLDRRARAGNLLAVASRLCGLHAQVMSSAELTAWARIEDLDRQAVQRALWDDRTLVKTWAMRGTLHLLPADELPLWRAALSANPQFLKPKSWQTNFGITVDELDRFTEAVGDALNDRMLTRKELAEELTRLTGSPAFSAKLTENSWGTMLRPAAFTGRLCFGPSLGQRVQFTHPDSWLAAAKNLAKLRTAAKMDSQEATAVVARRFLAAYGPATYRDLGRWWGAGVSKVKHWIAALGKDACEVDLDGTPAWMLTADARRVRDLPLNRSVRLLPGFDQYVVTAACHTEHLMPGDFRGRVFRPQGWISPILLVNGRMDGVWRHEIKGNRVEVTIEPFIKTPSWARRAAGEEAERLAAFLGRALTVAWKS